MADDEAPPVKRQRLANFTETEVFSLLQDVMLHRSVLFRSRHHKIKNERKQQVWTSIADKLTLIGGKERTATQVMKKWNDLKMMGRTALDKPGETQKTQPFYMPLLFTLLDLLKNRYRRNGQEEAEEGSESPSDWESDGDILNEETGGLQTLADCCEQSLPSYNSDVSGPLAPVQETNTAAAAIGVSSASTSVTFELPAVFSDLLDTEPLVVQDPKLDLTQSSLGWREMSEIYRTSRESLHTFPGPATALGSQASVTMTGEQEQQSQQQHQVMQSLQQSTTSSAALGPLPAATQDFPQQSLAQFMPEPQHDQLQQQRQTARHLSEQQPLLTQAPLPVNEEKPPLEQADDSEEDEDVEDDLFSSSTGPSDVMRMKLLRARAMQIALDGGPYRGSPVTGNKMWNQWLKSQIALSRQKQKLLKKKLTLYKLRNKHLEQQIKMATVKEKKIEEKIALGSKN